MILFKPEHAQMIIEGRKTQTRRIGKKRWNVGAIHQCKTKLFGVESFASVRILEVRREALEDITLGDVKAEGYDRFRDFVRAWIRINGSWADDLEVWVVTFELVRIT